MPKEELSDGFSDPESGEWVSHLDAALAVRDAALTSCAVAGVGYSPPEGWYRTCRAEMVRRGDIQSQLPSFIRRSRTLLELGRRIRDAVAVENRSRIDNPAFDLGYAEDGERLVDWIDPEGFILEAFEPLLDKIERLDPVVGDSVAKSLTATNSEDWLSHNWNLALSQTHSAPDAAITSARAFLEEVFGFILAELDLPPPTEKDDLNHRYKAVQVAMNLDPSEHKRIFRPILGGATQVVNGFAALRNSYSNSHAVHESRGRAQPRHAELAVNLAGSLAAFLLKTLDARGH